MEAWVVTTDDLVSTVYTMDEGHEEAVVLRACVMDRYPFESRGSTRPGVTRIDLVPQQERFAADEGTCRSLARILAHNRMHGTIRRAGDPPERGERF